MNMSKHRLWGVVLAMGALVSLPAAHAGLVDDLLGEPDYSATWSGFVRNENAISITSDENPFNQRGNIFNGVPVERNGQLADTGVTLFTDTVVRPIEKSDTTFNLQYIRGEINLDVGLFENLRFRAKLRAIGDPDIYDDQFNADDVPRGNSGRPSDPVGRLGRNDPNFFEYRYDSGPALNPTVRNRTEPLDYANDAFERAQAAKVQADEGSSPLEWAGRDYMVDLPSFYFDYQKGPLLVRAGNQQIAWGEMLFFRVLDVANGLDLRRHSILDFVSEEFGDKRIPSLGVRTSYLLPPDSPLMGGWEMDAYVQRFRPAIYPNPNTPYNVFPAQFTVQDQYKQYDDEYNYGLRMQGPVDVPLLGTVDMTLMMNRRYNHFGVFQWTDSDNVEGLNPDGAAGVGGGTAGALGLVEGQFAGELADSPLDVDTTGATSGLEFGTYAALARLNHFTALNKHINQFPGNQAALAGAVSTPEAQERQEDLFLALTSGLRGHITRKYERENNFGLGFNYRIEGPQDSLLFDQINMSLEAKYTPDRKYTPLDLSPYRDELIEEDELEVALVLQKFVRHSATFPSAFAVFQYLHRSESDIFNRHLSGYGAPGGNDGGDPDKPSDRIPDGISSANYVAFALQQPSPSRRWRVDLALLYDVKGGLLVQPALRWKPQSAWTFQVFANFIDTVHGNPLDNTLSTVEFADEITTRVEYQF